MTAEIIQFVPGLKPTKVDLTSTVNFTTPDRPILEGEIRPITNGEKEYFVVWPARVPDGDCA